MPRAGLAINVRISCFGLVLFSTIFCNLAVSQNPNVSFSLPSDEYSISASSKRANNWQEGHYDVWHLAGNVRLHQGNLQATANEAILWIDTSDKNPGETKKVLVYLDGDVSMLVGLDPTRPNSIRDRSWFGRLLTKRNISMDVVSGGKPSAKPAVYARADRALVDSGSMPNPLHNVANQNPFNPQKRALASGPTLISPQTGRIIPSSNRNPVQDPPPTDLQPIPNLPNQTILQGTPIPKTEVSWEQRFGGDGFNVRTVNTNVPGEQITIGTGGVRIHVDSERLQNIPQVGLGPNQRITILADSFVAWRNDTSGTDRWELYLEGDVLFLAGQRTIKAKRMYYDPNFKRGTILDTEMLTPIPGNDGLARLKADVIRQVDENNWQAHGAAVTTSRMGVPRYWLQSDALAIRRQPNNQVDPYSGGLLPDAESDRYFAEAGGNAVYFGGIPIFYWPTMATELSDPVFYLRSIRLGNDGDFGFQVRTAWDLFQVLGLSKPNQSDWIGRFDYLTERGPGFGTDFDYQGPQWFGFPGDVESMLQSYFIYDSGTDNLGFDRRIVPLEKDFRGHILMRSTYRIFSGVTLKTERGWISDRNFLEQYYERHWDEYKDYATGMTLEANLNHHSWILSTDFQINDFFTETENLPKLDHFMIGQSILFDRLVWHSHSHVGFRKFRVGNPPTNPVDAAKYDPLAWESSSASGAVAATRHEIDLPVQIGPVKVVPYIMGEAAYWQEDLLGNDTFRGLGQTGVRSSLPMWRVDPTICSELFNVKGLAHKVSIDSEVLFADASQNLTRLPLYDALDDNAQEHFRRRFLFDTFGLTFGDDVPLPFDERIFAYRYGMQRYVASPTTEIVDDLAQVRLGVRNRWQTKRGLPGRERIVDWISFDMAGVFFPKANRDNFGQNFGLVDFDFRWHLGDRLSFLSDGFYDFFSQGLRTTSIGMMTSRPGVGQAYLGLRSIEGPISSNVVQGSLSYRMSDKWGLSANSSVDFGDAGSIGSRVGFVYIGESFLWNLGVNYDASRGNTGFIFAMEPRFLRSKRLLPLGGQTIGPASSQWLE